MQGVVMLYKFFYCSGSWFILLFNIGQRDTEEHLLFDINLCDLILATKLLKGKDSLFYNKEVSFCANYDSQ